jgi:hypothetical protein
MTRSLRYRCLQAGRLFGAAACAVSLWSCTSNAVGTEPDITMVNPVASSKLQFAVGVATINETSQSQFYHGLNTVETLRQPDGLSAVLSDTPYITGPPGFDGQPDPITDAATNIISGSGPGISCSKTTFGCGGGAFGYGFANANTQSTTAPPSYALFGLPVAVGNSNLVTSIPYYSGPPAFPQFNNGTFPAGFLGYSPGFVSFQAPPVLGNYRLDVDIPNGPNTFGTISATATLSSTTPLPPMQAPQAFPDPNHPGGLLIDIVVPNGVTETWVWVEDSGGCYPHTESNSLGVQYYTVQTTLTGSQQLTVPPNLGPTDGSGSTPTICTAAQNQTASGNPNATADNYIVYAAGFDYPAFGAAYPFNTQQEPAFVGPNGQVDVTATEPAFFTYN